MMQVLPGPDFPTGGIIVGDEGIRQAYSTGRGRLIMRGVATIEEVNRGGMPSLLPKFLISSTKPI